MSAPSGCAGRWRTCRGTRAVVEFRHPGGADAAPGEPRAGRRARGADRHRRYLFPETYRFIDELTERPALNLKIYRADSAWPGRRPASASCGEQGVGGDHLPQPAQQGGADGPGLNELGARTWFSGLRRGAGRQPGQLPVLAISAVASSSCR